MRIVTIAAVVVGIAGAALGQVSRMPFDAAAPVLAALAGHLPADLRDKTPGELASLWPEWVAQRDRAVRDRLARGDEDSLVNLWLYGTSFTAHPRAIAAALSARAGGDVERTALARLEDFVDALASPGSNERLVFARAVLLGRGIDPTAPAGRDRARRYLVEIRRRMIDEFAAADRALASVADAGGRAAAFASIFRERGLSSDTSLLAGYGVASALDAIAKQGLIGPRGVRRVAVVGPGLDFTNKADGYDFYPQQTIQPFAIIDTLMRLGLAAPDVRVTTIDVSDRVNDHLRRAVDAAAAGAGYAITLPMDGDEEWHAGLLAYWQEFGSRIGEATAVARPPAAAGNVRVRAVRVAPAIAGAITPRALNVVFERLDLAADERFDLIVATNVLVYYDVFEQALALVNVATMLRPGGVLLTNNAALPTPPMRATAEYLRVAFSPRQYDEMFWYQRQ